MATVPILRLVRERTARYGAKCQTPRAVVRAVLGRMAEEQLTESMWAIALDGQSRCLAIVEVARGGCSSCAVSARDILRPMLCAGAHAFVLAHNHPSGDPFPSDQDRTMTTAVRRAADIVGCPLVDHVILVSEDCLFSMADTWETALAS